MSDLCKTCDYRKAVYRNSHYRFSKYKIYFCSAKGLLNLNVRECGLYVKKKVRVDVGDRRFEKAEKDLKYLLEKLDND